MRINCLSICRSPLTHMMGVEGNEQIVMREPVMTSTGIRWVPMITGNAIRHRMFRAPAARYLIDAWGLAGSLTTDQLNFLFNGGRLTQKGGRVDLKLQSRLYTIFPHLKLLGCSLPGQIVPGGLTVDRGMLICGENRQRLASALPKGFALPSTPLRPAVAYIQPYQYVRSSAKTSAPDVEPTDSDVDVESGLMIMGGQCVIPGAAFWHGFSAPYMTGLELGSLLHSLRLWQHNGATIGGQSAKGHGKLETLLHLPKPGELNATFADQDALIADYQQHVVDVADEGRELLDEIFGVEHVST